MIDAEYIGNMRTKYFYEPAFCDFCKTWFFQVYNITVIQREIDLGDLRLLHKVEKRGNHGKYKFISTR